MSTTERSLTELIGDISEQTTRLVRTEARLAAREMATKARRAGVGGGALAAAASLAAYAFALLLASLTLALATTMPAWLAALIPGAALLLAAAVAALIGRAQLRKALPPIPDDALTRLREDVDVVRERTHS
jgi:hypothetical protein